MTIKTRSLVASALCCLGIACVDASPAREAKPKEAPSAPAPQATKPTFAQEELAALAAVAEARPSTILDQKKPEQAAAELPRDPSANKDEAKSDAGKDTLSLAAEHEEPIDYSRTVTPDELKLDRFVLATGVEDREPLGESDVFTTDTKKIFAFMQFANGDAAPFAFRVHWEPVVGPASPYGVELHVKTAPRFRTWSWTAISREPGQYRAVLRTLDGEEIASRTFVIEPALKE